jgi:hypothetical protein
MEEATEMAKITANGDAQRWKFRNDEGSELVYTSQGRLLLKALPGGRFKLLVPNASEAQAGNQAAARGMRRVAR